MREVVELLEAYLEVARNNSFGHIAIAMTGHPNIAATDFAGDISLEESTQEALRILSRKVDDSIANWSLPPRDETLDASFVCYNVANGPLGYDFLVWLVDAEMTRRREGAAGPLKVAFWLGRDAADRLNLDHRRMWLEKVFRPSLAFIGAVEDSTAIAGRNKPLFVSRDIVKAARAGENVPFFNSPMTAPEGSPVTITLREADHWPHRNSNMPAWIRFARYLRQCGESVVFVRDTAKAYEPLKDFVTSAAAATDIQARMALYGSAKANLFVSNGPATLALFGDRPWLQFVALEEDGSTYNANTRKFWNDSMGVAVGDQYPWSTADQRLVWAKDNYENILAAWNSINRVSRAA